MKRAPRRIDSAPRGAKIGRMTRDAPLAAFRKLPYEERFKLVEQLWSEIEREQLPIPDWHKEELDRCLEDTPENVANLSWDEVRKNLGIPPE